MKKMNKRFPAHALCSLLVIFVISACSSTDSDQPETVYYLFDANPSQLPVKSSATKVKLSNVSLALYLKTSNLIMLDEASNVVPANFHLWADGLESAIKRALLNDLNSESEHIQFVQTCHDCVSIMVHVDHFYPNNQGKVLLAGHWLIEDSNMTIPFYIEDELEEDGYAHAVLKMRAQVKRLSKRIFEQQMLIP
jgi:uncharacterized lipoprotein YmbA